MDSTVLNENVLIKYAYKGKKVSNITLLRVIKSKKTFIYP